MYVRTLCSIWTELWTWRCYAEMYIIKTETESRYMGFPIKSRMMNLL